MAKLQIFTCVSCGGSDDPCVLTVLESRIPLYCPWSISKEAADWIPMIATPEGV